MWTATLGVVALAFLTRLSVAATNEFRNPPPSGTSATFNVGDSQTIKWNTSYSSYNISLWQTVSDTQIRKVYTSMFPHSFCFKTLTGLPGTDGDGVGTHDFPWVVQTYDANMSISEQFYFRLRPKRGASSAFNSSIFTIPNTTTSGNQDSNSGSSDTALKVGLGVGLGVGIPLVLIAGVWIGMKVVRQRRPPRNSVESSTPLAQLPEQKIEAGLAPPPFVGELPHHSNEVHEAPPDKPPVELPGDVVNR
ncbi:hypothetical protein HDK77DRAFT_165264 [Phyllosticta capitalensis]